MILRLLLSLLLVLALATPSWARIVVNAAGALATGTTSVAVPFPASTVIGDILVLSVINKYPNNGPTLPTDAFGGVWVAPTNGQASGGFGADTTDLGHVYTTWYYKIATGTETGNLTVTVGSGNSAAARMLGYRNSTGKWSVAAANAAVDLSATAWSASMGTDPGLTVNDIVIVASGGYTDATTFGTHAFAMTGMTFGTVTEGTDSAVTDGDDMRYVTASATVSTGTSSDASFVYTATASGLTGGSSVLIRFRESPNTPAAFSAISALGSGTVTANVTAPATINAGDLLVYCIANKYPTNAPSTPADAFGGSWLFPTNGQGTGGSDPDGVDTGHTYATIYTKIATGTEDAGSITVGITSGNSAASYLAVYTNTTGGWSLAASNGADATVDTSWSVTAGADPGVQAGDIIVACSSAGTDTSLMTETTETMTHTGVVYGLSSERGDNGTSLGEDIGVKYVEFVAISGTSSAAPVFATTIQSSSGATAFLRIREDVAAVSTPSSGFLPAVLQ